MSLPKEEADAAPFCAASNQHAQPLHACLPNLSVSNFRLSFKGFVFALGTSAVLPSNDM